jgi:maleate isomerase
MHERKGLNLAGVDALVLSSCVQMPSLAAVQTVEDECGLAVVSAALAPIYQMLKNVELTTYVATAACFLSGSH